MNFSDLQNGIYDWISTESGLATIWQYANAPRPSRPYMSLLIPTITPIGSTEFSKVDSNGDIVIRQQNMMTLSINYHGEESPQNMLGQEIISKILLSTKKESVNQIFRGNGIGYMTRLAQNTLQNKIATSYEELISLDLSFMLVTDIIDNVGLIESVEIFGEYFDESGNLRYSQDIVVED